MKRLVSFLLILLIVPVLAGPAAMAQFGQNKITYERFDWKVYQSPHFDIHYYPEVEPFLEEVVSYAESAYVKLSKEFDHELRWRVPLIIYRTHAEFQQTNIDMREIPESTLAFAEPIQNRMVLPIDIPPDFLFAVITHELTHIFEFSFFFEGNLGRVIRSNPPLWLMEGLASYMAQDETNIDRMVVRDAVVNNVLPKIQFLDIAPFFAYRFGHALFDFIEQEHGKEGLRNFLFEYRKVLLTNNLEKAVQDSFGDDLDAFDRKFNRYLRKKYLPVLLEKKSPDDYGKEIVVKRPGVFSLSPTLSPSGELIAALSAPRRLEMDLFVLSAEDGSVVRNLTKGWTNKYRYLIAEGDRGKSDLSWSPTGDDVAVFARKENKRLLLVFDALRGKITRRIDLGDIVQGTSPAFSPDGKRIAFEGNRDGIVDLFEYDLETAQVRNLTQDDQFDTNPWYSRDGKTVLYNRRVGAHWKIFSVDLADPSRKTQITFGPSSDLQPSYSRDGKTVYFSSDRGPNGVFNIYALDVETGDLRQYTDVVGGCFAPVEMAERDDEPHLVFNAFFEGTYRLYRMPLREPETEVAASEVVAPAAEAEPFEPPLSLTVDEDKKADYSLRWDLSAPLVSVGVTDDGTFLADAIVEFSDLLGDHRVRIIASTVSNFSNTNVVYLNMKRRTNWGAAVFDYRDFYVSTDAIPGNREQIRRTTGASFFVQRPFNRHYRVQGSVGFIDESQDFLVQEPLTGSLFIQRFSDRFATAGAAVVGDTTRFQRFGPYQGKRFNLGVSYGANLGGDLEGNILQYELDFRAYRQLTRRSLLAWRLAGIHGVGDRLNLYPMGGINQLRGYDFRDFFGSSVVWTNLELRFPLVDDLRFPFLWIRDVRGFLFVDLGAAWLGKEAFVAGTFQDSAFFDPFLRTVRVQTNGEEIPFKFWDSTNDRLQDGRGSYGFGFQFFFLGGLQFNWSWAQRMDYTQYVFDPATLSLVPRKADRGGRRMDFYIVFDF